MLGIRDGCSEGEYGGALLASAAGVGLEKCWGYAHMVLHWGLREGF